jgi:hypothetical protein
LLKFLNHSRPYQHLTLAKLLLSAETPIACSFFFAFRFSRSLQRHFKS